MCQYKSAIAVKDNREKSGFRLLWSPFTESHEELVRIFKLRDVRDHLARVEFSPPDLKTARALAKAALKARLIACANLIPKIESHYWWQGKIESGAEVLLMLKTTKAKLVALEKLMLAQHPYATPEFLVLSPSAGSQKYLDWLAASCGIN